MKKYIFLVLLLSFPLIAFAQERWVTMPNGWQYDSDSIQKIEKPYSMGIKGKKVWYRFPGQQPTMVRLYCSDRTFAYGEFEPDISISPESPLEGLFYALCKPKRKS
jgi:hypothetical protein